MNYENETLQQAREAWLITWERAGEHAKVNEKVAAIISSRVSQSSMEKLVERIWASKQLYWFEQVAFARL